MHLLVAAGAVASALRHMMTGAARVVPLASASCRRTCFTVDQKHSRSARSTLLTPAQQQHLSTGPVAAASEQGLGPGQQQQQQQQQQQASSAS